MQKWIKGKVPSWTKALLEYSALMYRTKNRGVKRNSEDELSLRLRDHLVRFESINEFGEVVERKKSDQLKLSRKFKGVGG
ncbi:hypothetical protein L3V82_08195 [Thiotrichales bacterium 19S3-7]|nr:hypothetical protein [Thiotrichales bacterium 19S3-7]MCF6802235.1 hypothetical protein [Thiotrichales bacterium 19S3-11]